MGNCCCVLRSQEKKKFKSSQKPGSKRCKKAKNYYKYGDDEYDNDDFDDDYDRQTTKSDLSSSCKSSNHIKSDNSKKPRRLLDKAILNQHLKAQQLNSHQQQHHLSSSSSSTILLLKQSHLVQPSTNRLTDNNSSSDQLILNSISSTVITTSKSSYNDTTPKLVKSCHSMKSTSIDDLTSNSEQNENFDQKRRLVFQKRNSNLNHSLNETDLVINNSKSKINKKRKLKQRKIDLMNEDEVNNSYQEDEEYNSDDALSNNKLKKNYLNYRSLQKSKRSIKSIEQTIKNSKSIEKWLNDFDKIKELDQPSIPESPQTTIQRSDTTPNEDLYSLFEDKEDVLSKKIKDLIPKNLLDIIDNFCEINQLDVVRQQENEMYNYVKKMVLPKSLANADDINYLKWLLNEKNFTLLIEQPLFSKYNCNYMLECKNININLVDCDNESDGTNLEDQCYIKYLLDKQTLLLDQDKIRYIINKEKELTQTTNINNQGVLESFREKYIESSNFVAVQSLLNICKKSSYKKSSNLSNSCSSSSTSSTPILNTSTQNDSNLIPVNFSDLNDKLFLCFLSNFSCKLVDTFLQNTQNIQQSHFNSAGFIRKHKLDKSFSYVTNENDFKSSNFKLYIKLNRWPKTYDFLNRLKFIKSQYILEYIDKNTCLITNMNSKDEFETSFDEFGSTEKWIIDTRLAETVIFKTFNKCQLAYFYYLYNILNNLKHIIEGGSKKDEFIGNRVLLHHYLRFIDSNPNVFRVEPSQMFLEFSSFLRSSMNVHSSLNTPNFFNQKIEILNVENELSLNEFSDLLSKSERYFKKSSKPIEISFKANTFGTNKIFNEYLNDFFEILFDQFKSKRDHFKINEQVLIDIHGKVIQTNENLNFILTNGIDVDISSALLSKFEMYAECVHKYLPQIRQHNQYLLFHYIWTMQVQYLAPFFNYICDLYKSYN